MRMKRGTQGTKEKTILWAERRNLGLDLIVNARGIYANSDLLSFVARVRTINKVDFKGQENG